MQTAASIIIPRLGQAVLVVLIVLTVVFFMNRVTGDPIRIIAPVTATPEDIARLRKQAGLDKPIVVQYVDYLKDTAELNMGDSFRTGLPAIDEVRARIWPTIELGLCAMAFALIVGVSLGTLAATHRGTIIDAVVRLIALLGQAMPSFWLGLLLIIIFAVKLHVLPSGGTGSPSHLILPSVTLGAFSTAAIMRLTRSEMIDVLSSDYIRTARSKGLAERTVIIRHALRNSMLSVLTVIGIQVGSLIAGAVIVETVFSWPGMGRLIIQSINNADYPVVQLTVIIVSATIVISNAVVDISYAWIDPRTEL